MYVHVCYHYLVLLFRTGNNFGGVRTEECLHNCVGMSMVNMPEFMTGFIFSLLY